MTDEQKKMAGFVAFGLIALSALLLAWLAFSALVQQLTAATFAGSIFFLLIGSQSSTIFGALGLVVTAGLAAGVGALGSKYLRAGVGVILLGLAASIALWIIICGTQLGRTVSQNLPDRMNIDHAQLEALVQAFSSWGIGAWAAALVALLGINTLKREK